MLCHNVCRGFRTQVTNEFFLTTILKPVSDKLKIDVLFCIERVTYQELPQNNAKCKKKGRQKGRAKRALLLLMPFFLHCALFWGNSWQVTLSIQNSSWKEIASILQKPREHIRVSELHPFKKQKEKKTGAKLAAKPPTFDAPFQSFGGLELTRA